MKIPPLRSSIPRSLTLYTFSTCGSLCLFSGNILNLCSQSQVLGHQIRVKMIPSHAVILKSTESQSQILYSHKLSVIIAPTHLAGSSTLLFAAGQLFTSLLWKHTDSPQDHGYQTAALKAPGRQTSSTPVCPVNYVGIAVSNRCYLQQ